MAYMKSTNTLISSPIEPAFAGIAEALGFDYGAAATAGAAIGGSVLNLFGQKEQTKISQAQARIAEAQAAQAAAQRPSGGGGIPTVYLAVGGLAIVGALVFAMRRK
jgi:hypothetical protein